MDRRYYLLVVILSTVAAMFNIDCAPVRAAQPMACSPLTPTQCSPGTASSGQTVYGWLAVSGRGIEAAQSAESRSGCDGCVWTITRECLQQSGQSGPGGEHCDGLYVGCPGIDKRIVVQFAASAGSPLQDVDQYCYATPDGGGHRRRYGRAGCSQICDAADRLDTDRPSLAAGEHHAGEPPDVLRRGSTGLRSGNGRRPGLLTPAVGISAVLCLVVRRRQHPHDDRSRRRAAERCRPPHLPGAGGLRA